MSENKSKLSVTVSMKDTEIFKTLLSYTGKLIEILSAYELTEEDREALNEISGEFFSLGKESE